MSKVIMNRAIVEDACTKAKKLMKEISDETKRVTQLFAHVGEEENTVYLSELLDMQKKVQRDVIETEETVAKLLKAVEKDLEDYAKLTGSIR